MLKRWMIIFKVLSNINRLKIIKLLADGTSMVVGDIADEINISFKSTSKHLVMLRNLDILESVGREGHVRYSLNRYPSADLRKALSLFLNKRL